jgi:hypothetical protein
LRRRSLPSDVRFDPESDRDRVAVQYVAKGLSFEIVFVPTSQANSILKPNLRISFSSRFEFLSFRLAVIAAHAWPLNCLVAAFPTI